MSPYTSFALAGPGGIGSFIAEHLAAAPGASLKILTRNADTKAPTGAEVKVVDYSSEDDLAAALEGVQVVISALNGAGFAAQPTLAKAAKRAGAKLFVPSEFGNDTRALTDGPLIGKTQLQGLLKSIGLDYLLVFPGPFTDTVYSPHVGFELASGKANIIGEGNNPISQTTRDDVGRFLAHVLTHEEPASLANQALRIQGDVVSFNEAIKLYEASHPGTSIDVTYTSRAETEQYIKEHPGLASVLQYLRLSWDINPAPTEDETAHALWSEWKPTKLKEVLSKL